MVPKGEPKVNSAADTQHTASPSGPAAAVDDVSLEIADGELLVLVGPSGCGKSTTLRLIAGLEDLDAGEIFIGGKRVDALAPKDRNISMVFQNYALYPHMNVYDNLAFGLKLRAGGGWLSRLVRKVISPAQSQELEAKRAEIPEKVQRVAAKLGIDQLLRRMPRELSGGERQRVALGRAIVREPVAFLFDEPLSNLDAKLRVEMRREIKRLHQELAATMIYVTHDQVEAMTLGDRIAIMNRGKIVQCDSPENVYARPAHRFVAGFIGSPPMNLIRGWLETDPEDKNRCDFVGNTLRVSLPPELSSLPLGDAELGVRPETIELSQTREPQPGQVRLAAGNVELVESLGDLKIVQLRVGSEDILVRTSDRAANVGETWQLTCPAEALHFFDGKTGQRLEVASG